MDHKKIITLGKPEKKRKNEEVIGLSKDVKKHASQVSLLKLLKYNPKETEEKEETEKKEKHIILAKREINKKIASYKKQDIDKKRYIESKFISFDESIDLLLDCNLLCYYCQQQMYIFYDNVREKSQWTLDRIDNDICHSKDNLVVSCLACNLQKRRRESEAFKFMKQMKIEKKE